MGTHQKLITEDLYKQAIAQLASTNKENRTTIRLRAIVAAKEHGIGMVSKIFNITTNTLRNWVKSFAQGDDKNLEYKKGRGRKSDLTESCYEAINKWIQEDCNITIKSIVIKLKENLGINVSKSAVHRSLHKLKFAYITPRPVHYKQNKETHEQFKKNSRKNNKQSKKFFVFL